MEAGGSSISRGGGRGSRVACGRGRMRPGQSRRAWSTHEEEVLVASLKSLIAKRWKSDNGFRAGYLSRLEESMSLAFPGTDLKGTPHINSKLTTWKRTYVTLAAALSRSGVGFNESSYTIDCTDETWSAVVKADKNAENLRYKSFPLYPAWIEFFGKDRANGERAEDVQDAFTNLLNEDTGINSGVDGDYHVSMDHMLVDEGEDDSVCGEEPLQRSPSISTGKKRKASDAFQPLYDLVGELVTNTNELKDVAKYIGYEFGLGQKRERIFNLLSTMTELNDWERYDLADLLGKDSDRLEVFEGLPLDHKEPYLRRLMARYEGN